MEDSKDKLIPEDLFSNASLHAVVEGNKLVIYLPGDIDLKEANIEISYSYMSKRFTTTLDEGLTAEERVNLMDMITEIPLKDEVLLPKKDLIYI